MVANRLIVALVTFASCFFLINGEVICEDKLDNRWAYFGSIEEEKIKMDFFFDRTSITRHKNNIVKVWKKMSCRECPDSKGFEMNNLEEIDCSNRTSRSHTTLRKIQGKEYFDGSTPSAWQDIRPESIMEALFKQVCKKNK